MSCRKSPSRKIQEITPEILLDLYTELPEEHAVAFVHLLGGISTAAGGFAMASELPAIERHRFAGLLIEDFFWREFPLMYCEARRLAREDPNLSDEEFDKAL